MKEKGQRPLCATEFTHNEILAELAEKNGTVLDIEIDEKGKESYKFIKKDENA
jgi:hypothetical protein